MTVVDNIKKIFDNNKLNSEPKVNSLNDLDLKLSRKETRLLDQIQICSSENEKKLLGSKLTVLREHRKKIENKLKEIS